MESESNSDLKVGDQGNILYMPGDIEDAKEQYLATLSRSPNDYDALVGLARCLACEGNRVEVESRLKRAIEIDAERPDGFNCLGVLLQERADPTGALQMFRHAIKVRPGDYYGWYGAGTSLIELDRIDEGIEHLRHGKKLNSEFPWFQIAIDVTESERGRQHA